MRRMRKKPKIYMNADVDSISDEIVRQCRQLLGRLPQTIPFPVSTTDTALALLPPMIQNYVTTGGSEPQFQNLSLSLTSGQRVHVAIAEHDEWVHALEGEDVWRAVFWLYIPIMIPVPDQQMKPYRLFEAHPFRKEITEWYAQAFSLQEVIEDAMEDIKTVARNVSNAALLRHVWPELLSFVKLQGPTVMHVPKPVIDRVRVVADVAGDVKRKGEITTLLTSAALLHEVEVNAWVGFKVD